MESTVANGYRNSSSPLIVDGVCDRGHLTQRLVELGHLGMIPACRLGLVAGRAPRKKRQRGQNSLYISYGFTHVLCDLYTRVIIINICKCEQKPTYKEIRFIKCVSDAHAQTYLLFKTHPQICVVEY